MKKAIIDIGSNTIRLEVYNVENGNKSRLFSEKITAGLVGYIKDGYMNEQGQLILLEALREYKSICEAVETEQIYPFATASMRYIKNASDVLQAVKDELGLHIRMIAGEEEAVLDFYGLKNNFSQVQNGVMVDVGGGSTQILRFVLGETVHIQSLPIGSLSLFRDIVKGILPKDKEWEEIKKKVKEHMNRIEWLDGRSETGFVTGGTGRAFARLHRVLNGRNNENVNGYTFSRDEIEKVREVKTEEKLSHYILKVAPDRIHTLLPGCAIIAGVFKAAGIKSVTVSQSGVREGYWSVIEREGSGEHVFQS